MKVLFEHLQRSGGHAVINWFLSHFEDYKFYNDLDKNRITQLTYQRGNGSDVFYSLENKTYDHTNWLPDFKIVILRDVLNWSSSIFKRRGELSFYKDDELIFDESCLNFYKEYYKKYKYSEYYSINFNKWFESYNYRRKIERDFGLNENDSTINEVLSFGNGSSFDALCYQGKGQTMDVLNRWTIYKNEKFIQDINNDSYLKLILSEEFSINNFL